VPSVVAGMVSLVSVYGIVRALHGRAWLAVLAAALYSLDILSFVHGRIGTLDMLSLGFLLLGAWLALRKDWILAGGVLALGTLVKVPGVYGFAAVFAYRMLGYGFALQGGFSPSGITSAPWQWLVNDGQFDYFKTAVNTVVNGTVTGSRTVIQFRALLNPVLIGSASLGVLYAAWLAWRRGEPVASFGLVWIAANYLPFYPLVLFSHRISYFYYVLPAVPGLALVLAAVLVHARLPRFVIVGFVVLAAVAFVAYFPFREIPG
jgi:4-amino-4-deoxy-L-arabinose transferase-like glycosyltransferase